MKRVTVIALLLLLAQTYNVISAPPMMTQNDFLPLHSTLYPFDFLNLHHKEYEKGLANQTIRERMRLSVSVVGQKATTARNQAKETVEVGDYRGRWNMLGLLYGNVPTGQTRPALLTTAAAQTYHDGQLLNHENYTDINDNLGHFSIPLKYRKLGVRFDFSVRLAEDLLVKVEAGIADIRQVYSAFTNMGQSNKARLLSNSEDYHPDNSITDAQVEADLLTVDTNLMDNHQQIFDQMGLNIQDYHATGAEDVFVTCLWRHNFHINTMKDNGSHHDYIYEDVDEWGKFIMTPFFKITGIVGIGKKQDPTRAFSMPFGNNGHHGVSLTTGFSMDFYESVEISWEAGTSHYFKRDIAGFYVPTNEEQTGVFPFKTDVSYDPGKTWFFSCAMHAYHMIDKLSCYLQYIFTTHSKDSIKLIKEDTAFKPHVLENQTKWTVQAANIAFNYDLSPHMTAGFAWQAPIARRGAYKTNAIAITLAGTF